MAIRLTVPEPRDNRKMTDEEARRTVEQSNDGAAPGNPLVPSEAEVDPMDIEADSDGFTPEVSDQPLARNVVEFEVNEGFDGDMPIGVIV